LKSNVPKKNNVARLISNILVPKNVLDPSKFWARYATGVCTRSSLIRAKHFLTAPEM